MRVAVSQRREPTQVVGRYAVYGEIASGGMATIHLGRLLGPVGFSRTVAIKRLHPQYTKDEEFVAMFLDEARLAARIQSPNVVQTMDVVSEGETLFLVMEYIQGESFSRLWRAATQEGGQIGLGIVSAVVGGMLHGLHAVHEATDEHGEPLGIVHRDVSPQNVIVGIDGTPRVLDFGVAKAAGRLQQTREGQLKGKLQYMAPEQLTGKTVARTIDIYAAAIVLWEALTGTRLYDGENDARIFQRVFEADAPPPSHLVPDVPPELDAVVMKGLQKDPAKRYQTAREFALALEAVVRSAPATEVGAWCERLAKVALEKRATAVHDLESSSAVKVPPIRGGAMETPPTVREAFQPVPLPVGEAATKIADISGLNAAVPAGKPTPDDKTRDPYDSLTDDPPTEFNQAYNPSKSMLMHTPPPPLSAPAPMSTNLAGGVPAGSSPDLSAYANRNQIGAPVSNPSGQIPGAPMSSGSWPGAPSSQQYPGSSQSGSISKQVVATAYDASGSLHYNPSASVQIIEAPGPSFAMKLLIAVTTMAAVFFLFAAAIALKNNLHHPVAALPQRPPTAAQTSTPTPLPPINA